MKKLFIALLMKRSSETLSGSIDDVVKQMVYGNARKAPGDDNCPYQKLLLKKDNTENMGIWAPPNSCCKAIALKWFFPNISGPFKLPETMPVPPHLLVGYDSFKYRDVLELAEKYPGSMMKHGFFTSDIPGVGQLIGKNIDKFEKRTDPPTYEEKIVIQLAKTDESFMEYSELGPSYMSPDTVQGEEDAKWFFPPNYDIPEEIIKEIKKKPRRKGRNKFVAVVEAHENQILQTDKQTETETQQNEEQKAATEDPEDEANEDKNDEEDEDEEEDEEEEREGEEVDIDKATSPMEEIKND